MSTSPRTSGLEDLLTRQQRAAWCRLVALAADRAAEEARLEQNWRSAEKSARAAYGQAKEDLAARRQQEREDAAAARESSLRAARTEFESEYTRTREAYDRELAVIADKAESGEAETTSRLEEAVWLAETVFEASEDRPQEEFDKAAKVLQAKRDDLDAVADELRGYLRRIRQGGLGRSATPPTDPASGPTGSGESRLDACLEHVHARLGDTRALRLPRLFIGIRPFLLLVALAGAATVIAAWLTSWQFDVVWPAVAGGALLLGAGVLAALHLVARRGLRPLVASLLREAANGHRAADDALRDATVRRDQREAELRRARDKDVHQARSKFEPILDEIRGRRARHLARIEDKYPALLRSIEQQRDEAVAQAESTHRDTLADIDRRFTEDSTDAEQRCTAALAAAERERDTGWQVMAAHWKEGMREVYGVLEEVTRVSESLYPSWDAAAWTDWSPPAASTMAVPFGWLDVDLSRVPGAIPTDERLQVPGPRRFRLPAALAVPQQASLLIESGADGSDAAISALQAVMFRLLTTLPPGKVRMTILDPVGLGQNFAGFMHLADSVEALVTDRIWTETRHIEQRLTDLTDHMENVIQKYLRNEYETIAQYNEQAGEIAEPFRFLVIANFPVNFSDTAAKRLASIVNSGARCGVYTLIHLDTRQALPKGIDVADLRRQSITLTLPGPAPRWCDPDYEDLPLSLESPPDDALLTRALQEVGKAAKDSSRVEVPFEVIAPAPDDVWTGDATSELRVALGRSGATKLQELALGHGTSQHVLIAGKTGSGKSTLLHVLITNIGLWFRPDQVELYLVDFKKGVEFKAYAVHRMPHARAVAIESDREFGLSVLQKLDQELKRRGELFRRAGVQDIAGFRAANPDVPLPRTLLIIDEFQEFFVEDDKIGQDAALLLDRLVRQGRAFGIHVILGSQTLSGAYSLAKSTLGQMAVRIALQCSETDAYLIMSEDNSAARLLARPGEAIYNDASGLIEGNSPFQIVWLPDVQRTESLRRISVLAKEQGYEPPDRQIVFEGNAPADVRRNTRLAELLRDPPESVVSAQAWLGDAVAIKDPTAAVFRRQTGSNLLMVGQRDEAALAMMAASMVGLAAQHRSEPIENGPRGARFVLLDGSPADSPHAGLLERVAESVSTSVQSVAWREVPAAMLELATEVQRRQQASASDPAPIYLLVYGLARFRDLRQSEDYSFSYDENGDKPPAADRLFRAILRDGPLVGVHALIWCDTMTNVERALDRQALREFDMRVAFQMGATDSSNLIDNPRASKLGLRHALFHSEETGIIEKFRPYALPDPEWLERVAAMLLRDGGVGAV